MIQILTVTHKQDRIALCRKAQIEYEEGLSIIAVYDQTDHIGDGAIFKIDGECGQIFWLEMNDDLDLSVGLGKAILSIMEYRGVKSVTLPLSYAQLAKLLRFELKDEQYVVNLEGYFSCCCQHK